MSTLCDEANILPPVFYRWQEKLFKSAEAVFQRSTSAACLEAARLTRKPSPRERRGENNGADSFASAGLLVDTLIAGQNGRGHCKVDDEHYGRCVVYAARQTNIGPIAFKIPAREGRNL